jgi:hypothetical protein
MSLLSSPNTSQQGVGWHKFSIILSLRSIPRSIVLGRLLVVACSLRSSYIAMPSRSPRIPREQWESRKEFIRKFLLHEKHTVDELLEELREKHGFVIT